MVDGPKNFKFPRIWHGHTRSRRISRDRLWGMVLADVHEAMALGPNAAMVIVLSPNVGFIYRLLWDRLGCSANWDMDLMQKTTTNDNPLLPGKVKSPWKIRDIAIGLGLPMIILFFVRMDLDQYQVSWLLAFFTYLAVYMFMGIFAVFILRRRGVWSRVLAPVGLWIVKEMFMALLWGLVLSALSIICYLIVSVWFEIPDPSAEKPMFKSLQGGPNGIFPLAILLFSFTVAPIWEELFFRGFLYTVLKAYVPVAGAVIIQAAVFSVMHRYSLPNSILVAEVGLVLALVYERRKTLLTPIFLHGMCNAIWAVPLMVLCIQNYHVPARTWEEARTPPVWMTAELVGRIERQPDAQRQWRYAIDTWGSGGARQWKVETCAFMAVQQWFPKDRVYGAKAQAGIVKINFCWLGDYRRAVVEADKLLTDYPDQAESCAWALIDRGMAYRKVGDLPNSRKSFERVIREYKQVKDACDYARKEMDRRDRL